MLYSRLKKSTWAKNSTRANTGCFQTHFQVFWGPPKRSQTCHKNLLQSVDPVGFFFPITITLQYSRSPGSRLHQAGLGTKTPSAFLKLLPSKTKKKTTKKPTTPKKPLTPSLQRQACGNRQLSVDTEDTDYWVSASPHLSTCSVTGRAGEVTWTLLRQDLSSCYINTEKNRTLQVTDDVALLTLPPVFNSLKYCYWHLLVTRKNKQTRI